MTTSKKTLVQDVMTTDVVSVEETAAFKDIAKVLRENAVSALPVVTAEGRVRGVVSEHDLLLKEIDPTAALEHRMLEAPQHRRARRKAGGATARELMTAPPIVITKTATVEEAARAMSRHRVKRLPVVDALTDRLVGIISRRDVLRVFARPDDEVRDEIVREATERGITVGPDGLSVAVDGGVVTLRGTLQRRSLVSWLVPAAQHVEGVVQVEDHLTYEMDDLAYARTYDRAPHL